MSETPAANALLLPGASTNDSSVTRLLNRPVPLDYLAEWTAHVAAPKAVADVGTKSAVIFRIHQEWWALSTNLFQEVLEQWIVRTLPSRTNGVVRGLVNVRGELLICVSLEDLLGISSPGASTPNQQTGNSRVSDRLIVLNQAGGRFAFQVSELHGIHRYHPTAIRTVPATLPKSAAPYIAGILLWDGKSVGCLAEDLLVYALNKGLV